MSITTRARSVYNGDPPSEFLEWLRDRLAELTPEQLATATMEVRQVADMHMVGFRYTDS